MAFPSVLTGRHKIPGYIHNRIADLACAADAFETTHVVEYHAKSARRSSRIVGGIPESSPGHRGRSRTFRTIKRCPPGPNHDLAEPWVAVAWASPQTIEVPRPSESGQCRRPDVLGARRPRQTRRISRTSRVPGEAQTRPGSWALDSRAPRHSRGNPSPRLPCLASPANVRSEE